MALPALIKTYSTRRNVPLSAEATQSDIRRSTIWALKAHMMNQFATGTLAGSRHANSVWTMYYSCDGTTAGTAGDGVDRWPDYTKVVQNTSGSAHSWACLYNSTSGLYALIDANNATNSIRFSLSKVAFTGGTTTTGPTSTAAWVAGTTSSDGTTAYVSFIGDDVVTSTHYTHFITADDGNFYFLASRAGLGYFSSLAGIITSINAHGSDTYNLFGFVMSGTSGRGAGTYLSINAASGFVARTPNNSTPPSQGGASSGATFGATHWSSISGLDALTSNYPVFPLFMAALNTQICWRGQLPDLYMVGGQPGVGVSIPSAASQERTIAGDLIVPFTGGAPTM